MRTLLWVTLAILCAETVVLSVLPFLFKDTPTLVRYPIFAISFGIVVTIGIVFIGRRSDYKFRFASIVGYVMAVYIISGFTVRIVVGTIKQKDIILGLYKALEQLPANLPFAAIIGLVVGGVCSGIFKSRRLAEDRTYERRRSPGE